MRGKLSLIYNICYWVNFSPLNFSPNRTYDAEQPLVGFCLISLVKSYILTFTFTFKHRLNKFNLPLKHLSRSLNKNNTALMYQLLLENC